MELSSSFNYRGKEGFAELAIPTQPQPVQPRRRRRQLHDSRTTTTAADSNDGRMPRKSGRGIHRQISDMGRIMTDAFRAMTESNNRMMHQFDTILAAVREVVDKTE